MGKIPRYKASGFMLLSVCKEMRSYDCDTDNIAEGDALHDDTTGYATNATTALAKTFLGIANEAVDNSGGSKGDETIHVVPPYPEHQFAVAVETNTTIAQTNIGTIVDLQSVNTVDISDTTIAGGPGFFIDDIDISSDATTANTYGYAIGHFTFQS